MVLDVWSQHLKAFDSPWEIPIYCLKQKNTKTY
jgi:hypothetical protein